MTRADQQAIEALRDEIERRRLKHEAIAERLHWSKAKLSKILSGNRPARLAEFLMLCAVIGTPAVQVLTQVTMT